MADKKKHPGFKKVAGKIEQEYEKKGMSAVKAEKIGAATAGKIAREIKAKKK